MTKKIFFLLMVLNPFLLFAQSKPIYNSLMWEITGNGLTKPSYLYGTMHVSSKIAYHLSDSFYMAIKNCDAVALELNPNLYLFNYIKTDLNKGTFNVFNNYYGNYDLYKEAFEITPLDKDDYKYMFASNPALINNFLFRYDGNNADYEEDTYLDLYIFQSGSKLGKSVYELEDFDSSMVMAIKSSLPDTDEVKYDNSVKYSDNVFEALEEAYRDGNLDKVDSLSKLKSSINSQRYLINARNIVMARNLDALMKKQAVFAGVGAAHLPGDDGMITLLRNMGYTLRPVSKVHSKFSTKFRTKLEKTYIGSPFTTQMTKDSLVQFEAPGKLLDLAPIAGKYDMLYTDMVNGNYFVMYRRSTNGLFFGKNPESIYLSIDSLLYENIPGKILTKERIVSNNNFIGFNIVSKTKRGEYLRFNIFISPLEVFVFKVGGTGDFANSADADKFFKSIKFIDKSKNQTVNFVSKECGFEAVIPSYYKILEFEPVDENSSILNNYIYLKGYNQQKNELYSIDLESFFDVNYIEEDTFELNVIADKYIKDFDFELKDKQLGTFLGYPSMDVSLKSKSNEQFMFFKVFLKGPIYYLLTVVKNDNQRPDEFYNSFKFIPYPTNQAMQLYVDSDMQFQVNTLTKPNVEALKKLKKDYEDIVKYKYAKKHNGENTDYEYKDNYKSIFSSNSMEMVIVEYEKPNDFGYISSKTNAWKSQIKYFNGDSSLIVSDMKYSQDSTELNILYTDTASSRGIKIRAFIGPKGLYTLKTCIDTKSELPVWTKTFFETFRPLQVGDNATLFSSKNEKILLDLYSQDSTIKKPAERSINQLVFNDINPETLNNFVNNKSFLDLKLYTRLYFIRGLGTVKKYDFNPLLKDIYSKAEDSSTIQLAVLSALINKKNIESIKIFKDLVLHETPLSSASQINNLFENLYDSLPLSKSLFPEILELTRYPEYKAPIIELLANLVSMKIVDGTLCQNYKKDFLRDANDDLKRLLNKKSSDSDEEYDISSAYSYDGDDEEDEYYDEEDGDYEVSFNDEWVKPYQSEKDKKEKTLMMGLNKLDHYCILLLSYKDDPNVGKFFDKVYQSKNDRLIMNTSVLYLKNSLTVEDSILKNLSKNLETYDVFYNKLEALNKLNKFDNTYLKQDTFARFQILSDDFDLVNDTLSFIKKELVTYKNSKQGYVYFFKVKEKDQKYPKLAYVGLYPSDTTQLTLQTSRSNQNAGVFIDEEQMNKLINEKLDDLRMYQRKRYVKQQNNNFSFDYYDEY